MILGEDAATVQWRRAQFARLHLLGRTRETLAVMAASAELERERARPYLVPIAAPLERARGQAYLVAVQSGA